MRLRVRRRKALNLLCKILIVIFVLITLYLLFNSKPAKPESIKSKIFDLKVFVIENEIDVISIWKNYTKNTDSDVTGTLISISSHFYDGLHQSVGGLMPPSVAVVDYNSYNDMIDSVKHIQFQSISLAFTGLFNQIMWIYPMWVNEKHIYYRKEQYIGVNNNNLCICSFTGNISISNDTDCHNIFPVFAESIETDDCQLLNDHWTFHSMQEIYAVVNLNQIPLSTPVMVNINLDFFTIGHSNDLAVISSVVESIQSAINSLFCVHQLSDESIVDSWFSILSENVLAKQANENMQFPEIPTKLYCNSEPSFVKKKIFQLERQMSDLNVEQLKKLSDVGICIRESFDWKKLKKIPKLQLCSGDKSLNNLSHCNLSNDSCYNAEFHLQMEKLYKIFKDNIKQPTIISIIRSSRSGIVSHENQYYLENSLLSNLKKIYNLKSQDITYADNLLGGSKGWSLRNEVEFLNMSNEIS